jgi:mercuric ion transport protein
MKNSTLLKTGIVGTILALICCFTPLLVVLLGALGLASLIGFLDFILLPILAVFIFITLFALWKRQRV